MPCSRRRQANPSRKALAAPYARLTVSAPHRGDRRGADEEVQLQIGGRFAQMPSTPDLPGEHAIHLGVVECRSAAWCRSRRRHGRCRPTAVARPARLPAAARHRAASATSAVTTRISQPCCSPSASMRWLRGIARARVGWSAPDARHRARPGIRRSPVRSIPAHRSPDTLRRSAVAAASPLGCPGASSQPRNVDLLIAQRDLVFAKSRVARGRDPADDRDRRAIPSVASPVASRQICQSAPHVRHAPAPRRDRIPTGNSDPGTRCRRR